jgi:hypothetical protein
VQGGLGLLFAEVDGERLDHARVELSAGAAAQLGECLRDVERGAVGLWLGQRGEGDGDGDDPRPPAGSPRRRPRPGSRGARTKAPCGPFGGIRPGAAPQRTQQLRASEVLMRCPLSKLKLPLARVKTAPGKPAGAAHLALRKLRCSPW